MYNMRQKDGKKTEKKLIGVGKRLSRIEEKSRLE